MMALISLGLGSPAGLPAYLLCGLGDRSVPARVATFMQVEAYPRIGTVPAVRRVQIVDATPRVGTVTR